MNAVIYCRVSTKEQVDNLSLGTQERESRRYCERAGYGVARVFVERGESAKTADRPQLLAMLEWCRKNKDTVDVVVVYAVSRLARRQYDHHTIRMMLSRYGISLRSVTEPIDDSPTGKAMEGMLSVFSQLDNDMRSERTKAGMRARMQLGKWSHKAPLGYLNSKVPSLEPDPQVAPLVAEAFQRIASGRYSLAEATAYVNALGLRGRNGKPLEPKRLDRILRSPVYKGLIVSKNSDTSAQGDFQPIVSEETFDVAQAALERNGKAKSPRLRVRPEFPLKRTLRCARCSKPLTASTSKGNGGEYAYYRCRENCVKGRQEDVHLAFVTLLRRLEPTEGVMRLFREIVLDVWRTRGEEARRARGRLQERVDRLLDRKNKLFDLRLDGKVDEASFDEQLERLQDQIGELRLQLAEAQAEELDIESTLDFAEYALRNAARMWQGFDVEQRMRFQRLLFPDGLTFDGKGFGTGTISPVFKVLEPSTNVKGSMASPITPGWNQVVGWPREVQRIREIAGDVAA